ncbi:MAG TPA: hypothetical protein P5526_00520 [Anaerolineae bacterium]|nr:hypothetical protein [Anaerolineae bacterium]HRV90626.1 hypothetical protein [Anaerolineae bacterium]
MKWLKIVGLGIALWGLGLVWLEFKFVLLSPVVLGMVAIVAIALPAYRLGQAVGQYYSMASVKVVHPVKPTSPIFVRHHHSRPTHPMSVIQPQNSHSNPTRPMPVVN